MAFIIKRSFPLTLVLQQSVIWSSRREGQEAAGGGTTTNRLSPTVSTTAPPTWFIVQRGTISNFRQQPDSWPFRAVSCSIEEFQQKINHREKRRNGHVSDWSAKSLCFEITVFSHFCNTSRLFCNTTVAGKSDFLKRKPHRKVLRRRPFHSLKSIGLLPEIIVLNLKSDQTRLKSNMAKCNCSKTQDYGGLWGTGWK